MRRQTGDLLRGLHTTAPLPKGATGPETGERYCSATLVRVVCDGEQPFVAGLLIDPETQRCFFAAPILRHLIGHNADQLRRGFKRLGWRATIVKRSSM